MAFMVTDFEVGDQYIQIFDWLCLFWLWWFILTDIYLTYTLTHSLFLYSEQTIYLLIIILDCILRTIAFPKDDDRGYWGSGISPLFQIIRVGSFGLASCLVILHMNMYFSTPALLHLAGFFVFVNRGIFGAFHYWQTRDEGFSKLQNISVLITLTNWFILTEKCIIRFTYPHSDV
eukprot:UN31129